MREQTLIVFRENMFPNARKEVSFKDATVSHFVNDGLAEQIRFANLVIFIDMNGQTKILKNRFGNIGEVITKEQSEKKFNLTINFADGILEHIEKL